MPREQPAAPHTLQLGWQHRDEYSPVPRMPAVQRPSAELLAFADGVDNTEVVSCNDGGDGAKDGEGGGGGG